LPNHPVLKAQWQSLHVVLTYPADGLRLVSGPYSTVTRAGKPVE
jgi:hypothetical protein